MKRVLPTLIKREFWESKSLWIGPLAVAGFLVLMAIAATLFSSVHFNMGGMPQDGRGGWPSGVTMVERGVLGFAAPVFFVAAITCGFYLHECLYSERKDRSILFWKSLPVSDLQTVLSKLVVAMVVVPLGAFVLATLVFPALYAITALGVPGFSGITGGWSTADWLRGVGSMFASLVVTLLWYAPLAAWSMLASVFSRRSPIMISSLPVVTLGVLEGIVFHTSHVWKYLGHRFMPIVDPVQGFARPGMWIGLAVAAGILYIVVRLRRYRDDT